MGRGDSGKERTMKKRGFYKNFFSIYILLVLQNVLTLSVNLTDNIMLGAYSEISLSGVTAVNQIQFIFQQMLSAFAEGAVILGSQYFGKKDTGSIKKIGNVAMRFGIGIALILFGIVTFFPVPVMHIFTTETAIVKEGCVYLSIIRFTYLFFAVTTILLATLRTVQVVKIALMLSIVTLVVNYGINYTLIFGRFGAPRLGVTGAAIGTLAARILECGIVIFYSLKKEKILDLKFRDYFKQMDREILADYGKVTRPMFLVQSLWGINTALQTAILGHMTARAIAANSVASNLFLLVKSAAVGACSTASVIIGKAVGEGDEVQVIRYSKQLQKLFLAIGICSGVTLYFLRIPILGIYNLSEETRAMANSFLIILSAVCVGMSYQMPTNNGIIRGGGSPQIVAKIDIISIWGIVLPISFLAAFVFKVSPQIVVCCLNADQWFKCIPAFLIVNYGTWIRKLTR